MEIRFLRLMFISVLCMSVVACDKDEDAVEPFACMGTFVLNNGNWGDNDANIGVYDPQTGTYTPDMFYVVNSRHLGDLAQDIISLGDDVYIAVSGSRTIFVTDRQLRVKKQLNVEENGARLSPRCFASDGVNVYVSYYEGFVGRISHDDYSVSLVPVGPNPEGLAVAGDNLYVADSGGMSYPVYNNTLSVVSLTRFERIGTVEVNTNPAKVMASSDGSSVYVFSYGDYAAYPSMIQVLDVASGLLSDLSYTAVSSVAKGKDDILYILCAGYDDDWNPLPGTIFMHDMTADRKVGNFITDGTLLPAAYSISVPADGYVYVGCSDYMSTGDVYVFTQDGRLYDRFDSQGLNPIKVY